MVKVQLPQSRITCCVTIVFQKLLIKCISVSPAAYAVAYLSLESILQIIVLMKKSEGIILLLKTGQEQLTSSLWSSRYLWVTISLTMLSLEMTTILSIFPQGQKCLDLWSLTAESSSLSVDNSWQSLHRNVFCLVFQISLLPPFHCS